MYDESDLERRQERIMLETTLKQRDTMQLFTVHPVKLPKVR